MIRSKEELLTYMQRINDWIADNPDVTEPNMYQMIECVTNLGVLAKSGVAIEDIRIEWEEMYSRRFRASKKSDPNFSVNDTTTLFAYFNGIVTKCLDGKFEFPDGKEEGMQTEEFLEFTRKIGSVSLYINQQRLQNPDFKFNNQDEYRYLVAMAEKYKDYLPQYANQVIEEIGKDIILKDKKQSLLSKMQDINKWIADNPDVTEPNIDQMIDCVTQLGMIAREEGIAQRPNKFPEPRSDLAELYAEWNKMYRARLSWDKVQSTEFSVNKKTNLYAYFTDLNMRCCTGEFRYPGMDIDEATLAPEEKAKLENERDEFLNCVRKIGSVSLYINQQRLQNPNFVYDNQWEYANLADMAERYQQYLPAHSTKVLDDISDSRMLEQPQNPGGDDEPSL